MATILTKPHLTKDSRYLLNQTIQTEISNGTEHFEKVLRQQMVFHGGFALLGSVEVLLLVFFVNFLAKSTILAVVLAIVFLSIFSYFILRLYFKEKKGQQFEQVKGHFLQSSQKELQFQKEAPELHAAIASACCKFASTLENKEYTFFPLPKWLEGLSPTLEKLSSFFFWKDVLLIREILLLHAVQEHIYIVTCVPTNLEAHAALANVYVTLSQLYVDPRKKEGYDEEQWIPPEKFSELANAKFRRTAERAIEEFKILNDYAPNDPWVHIQLAYSYHDLGMPQNEILEYETILKLRPGDKEVFFKLGILYFQQGENAKGLKVYEKLKLGQHEKANELIKYYGAYAPIETTAE